MIIKEGQGELMTEKEKIVNVTEVTEEDKRAISNKRAAELKDKIADYLAVKDSIPSGLELKEKMKIRKELIRKSLKGTEADWDDWKWQLKNRITSVEQLAKLFTITEEEKAAIEEVEQQYRWAISPYYLSLIDPTDLKDPVRLQAIPMQVEITDLYGEDDPMAEAFTSPVPFVTRRYPDRLIINVTNQCGMYCRHCQRRRNIGEVDYGTPKRALIEAIAYVRDNPEIRDVLLTGGDSFMISDEMIEWILQGLRAIAHVEIIRFGTRTPVTLPQRITPELCAILEKYHPIYVNTQFNHPQEITETAAAACDMLTKAGIPLGNQAVLLNGINNDKHVMKKLNQDLLRIRVRPYYIFHAKNVSGTMHFNVRVEEGLEIMESLRGFTSGLAIPTYIINAPQGYGKTPVLPNYLISQSTDGVMIRTWEGRCFDYPNTGRGNENLGEA